MVCCGVGCVKLQNIVRLIITNSYAITNICASYAFLGKDMKMEAAATRTVRLERERTM